MYIMYIVTLFIFLFRFIGNTSGIKIKDIKNVLGENIGKLSLNYIRV